MEYNELIDEEKLDTYREGKELRIGDYAVFQSEYTEKITIGRICENIDDAHDEVEWIRVKEKDSLVPKWNCNSRYFIFDENNNEHWIVDKGNRPEIYDVGSGNTIESVDTEEELLDIITSKYSIFEEVRD